MSMSSGAYRNALPHGRKLQWYAIGNVLGQGAFGITYLAEDVNLGRQVAIKEYFPGQLATRDDTHTAGPLSDEVSEEYSLGLERFVNEAQILAKFEHPNIVRVHNVFELNNTAYMVMQYEEGRSLQAVLKEQGTLTEHEILDLVFPLMSGLETIHGSGFIHRDVKPANIFIRRDGSPVLLDFGSARQTLLDQTRTMTSLVSPGYAPIEQYTGKSDKQGPWSDIYGLGATLYRAVTGETPANAVERGEALAQDGIDTFQSGSARAAGRYQPLLLRAIDHALQFRIQDRPQLIAEWRKEFEVVLTSEGTMSGVDSGLEAGEDTVQTEPLTRPTNVRTERLAEPESPETIQLSTQEPRLSVTAIEMRPSGFRWTPVITIAAAALVVAVFIQGPADDPVLDTGPQKNSVASGDTLRPLDESAKSIAEIEKAERTEMAIPAVPQTADASATLANHLSQEDLVNDLLTAAGNDLAALRLTTPSDNNAYDKYREVLTIDRENEAAQRGVEAIADRYIQLAYRDIEADKLDRAKRYIDKADGVTPGRSSIRDARDALAATQTAANSQRAGSFPDKIEAFGKRIGDFFQSQQDLPTEATRADSFLRQLGR